MDETRANDANVKSDGGAPGGAEGATANGQAPADLTDRLAATERELQDAVALLKQTQADFQNYQARNAREREAERKYAVTAFARDLLTAYDNLDRALGALKEGEDGPLAQGVKATKAQLLQVFARHGITPVEAEPGQPFDPNRHEAVMQQPSAEYPAGTVVQVYQQGFQIHDRILRPSSVVVSTTP
jgi:molecular chaperone GrpE